MERRAVETELRVVRAEGKPATIGGYAVVFESESVDLGGFTERVARGALTASLSGDIRAHWNHDPSIVLGRTSAGTLRLLEDSRGLAFELDAPDTQAGRDALVSIERRDVTGVSFGFRAIKDAWAKVGGKWLRTLLECELFEVSPCAYPAYQATEVGVRALTDAKDALEGLKKAQEEEQQAADAILARERRLRLAERA